MELFKDCESKVTHYGILTISETELKQLIEACEWSYSYWSRVWAEDIREMNGEDAVSHRIAREWKEFAERLRELKHKAFNK